MKRITTIETPGMMRAGGGCGECQTSCQSASKTSCSVVNQQCERKATAPGARAAVAGPARDA